MTPNQNRFSKEQRQEDVSRGQFPARLAAYGWPAEPLRRDLGEDFLVRIYDHGQFSGLSFYAQIKSMTDIAKHRIAGDQLSYELEVKDLEHWSASANPVIVVIWNTMTERGYWIYVADAAAELDSRKLGWRQQKTVRVRVPLANGTDDNGLRRIRQIVADFLFPSVASGKPLSIKSSLRFPDTEEGKDKLAEFQRAISEGGTLTIEAEYIHKVEPSEWWVRHFDATDIAWQVMTLGPSGTRQPVPMRADFVPRRGRPVTIPYVEFREVKHGFDQLTISNEHQPISMLIELVLDQPHQELKLSLSYRCPGTNVHEARDVLMILRMFEEGAKIRFTPLTGGQHIEHEIPGGRSPFNPDPTYARLVEDLCLIEDTFGHVLTLAPGWGITSEDARTIHSLTSIARAGRVERAGELGVFRFTRAQCEEGLKYIDPTGIFRVGAAGEDSRVEVLGTTIQLGPVVWSILGKLKKPVAELRGMLAELGANGDGEVELHDYHQVMEFARWSQVGDPAMVALGG